MHSFWPDECLFSGVATLSVFTLARPPDIGDSQQLPLLEEIGFHTNEKQGLKRLAFHA